MRVRMTQDPYHGRRIEGIIATIETVLGKPDMSASDDGIDESSAPAPTIIERLDGLDGAEGRIDAIESAIVELAELVSGGDR